jgi:hypothetical protein
MSDLDIVEYLRKNAVFNYKDTYLKAADEIERLRAELAKYKGPDKQTVERMLEYILRNR